MRLGPLLPHPSQRSRSAVLTATTVALATAVAGLSAGLSSGGSPATAAPRTAAVSAVAEGPGRSGGRPPRHSSDGARGPIAPLTADQRRLPATKKVLKSFQVAPGLTYERWSQTDARGEIRAHLLTADLSTPGLALDYTSARHVSTRAPLSTLLARDRAVAGINGDFFDIHDTGAPLGVGRDRQLTMRNAPGTDWNKSFYLTADGEPHIGPLTMRAGIRQHPKLSINSVNSPTIQPGQIGIYTPRWGRTTGTSVTDGRKRNVRQVQIRRGRVVAKSTKLSRGKKLPGILLIGRGKGADRLRKLRIGERLHVQWRMDQTPEVAISGSVPLVRDDTILAINDREMHPRTAVGIDRETGHLLLLVIDGRSRTSRGYTLVELARMMHELGAEDALNLDGGGSSTLVAGNPRGVVKVRNRPSDGHERSVPNGLQLTYRAKG